MCHVEVVAGLGATVRPEEGHLERETVDQGELSPHDTSRGRLLCFVHLKGAVLEAEHIEVLPKQPSTGTDNVSKVGQQHDEIFNANKAHQIWR